MVDFADAMDYIEEIGGFDVVLPFLLVFTITFAILEKLEIFGPTKRNINAVFSVVAALLFIRNAELVGLLQRFLPNVSMFMVIILMFILIAALTSGTRQSEWDVFMSWLPKIAAIIAFVFVLWALTSDHLGDFVDLPWWVENWDEQTKSTVLFVGIFVLVIWWVTRPDEDEKSREARFKREKERWGEVRLRRGIGERPPGE